MKKILLFSLLIPGLGLNAQKYTVPSFSDGCVSGDYINSFVIPAANFNHLDTSCSTDAYGDFSSKIVNLKKGTDYNYSVTHEFSDQSIKIWIDFNNDGIFTDGASELVSFACSETGDDAVYTNGTLKIPTNISDGKYRMRIGNHYTSEPTPGKNSGYGEVHDYTVHVNTVGNFMSSDNAVLAANTLNEVEISALELDTVDGIDRTNYLSTSVPIFKADKVFKTKPILLSTPGKSKSLSSK